MEAKELRIKNYVQVEKEVGVVCGIGESDFIFQPLIKNIDYLDGLTTMRIEPIPLTEEWLLKFGFEEVFYICEYSEDESERIYMFKLNDFVYVNENQLGVGTDHSQRLVINNSVKHVHQLQNLYFALTGEELEIK